MGKGTKDKATGEGMETITIIVKDGEKTETSAETNTGASAGTETKTEPETEEIQNETNKKTVKITGKTDFATINHLVSIPSLNELIKDKVFAEIYNAHKEQLETAQKENVFLTADAVAKAYMLEAIIPSLPQKYQKKAEAVIKTVNFGTVKPEERPYFIKLAQLHQHISRLLIQNTVLKNPGGFNPIEKEEIAWGIEMADATDSIYGKWEFMQHDIAEAKDRKTAGLTSKWHIVQKDGGGYRETPYQEIYKEEYSEIWIALGFLINRLKYIKHIKRETDIDQKLLASKLDYYEKLLKAYQETDPEKLPALWLETDKAFVHQGGNLRAVHPIEDGYGANTTGMIPQQCLRYFVPSPANDLVAQKKNFILEKFPALLEGNEEAVKQLDYIKNVDAGIALYMVRSGMELVFKIAGHNIPNEEEARREGVHIYLDPNTISERLGEAKELFKGFFAPEYHGLLDKISDDAALAEIAVHEFGHNIGAGIFGRDIENAPGIEEWKATATTYVSQTIDSDAWTDEQLQGNFMSFLCQVMRYSQRRGEASQKPYYNADRFFMKLAQEAELIKEKEEFDITRGISVKKGGWKLELTRDNLLKYAEAVKDKWFELQKIYAAKDRDALKEFTEKAVRISPFMDDADKFTKPE